MDRSIRMRTSLSQMIAKGDSNIAQTDAIALAAHKMVKLYVYVVTHLNVRKDSLNARCTMHDARCDYYALLWLFAGMLVTFIHRLFSICLAAITISVQFTNR